MVDPVKKKKYRVFFMDVQIASLGLFSDAINSIVNRYQEHNKP